MNELTMTQVQQAIQANNVVQAQHLLAEMLVDDPLNEDGWLLLSELVPQDQSLESLERVLKINPDNIEAQLRVARLKNRPSPVNSDGGDALSASFEDIFRQTEKQEQPLVDVMEEPTPVEINPDNAKRSDPKLEGHNEIDHPVEEKNQIVEEEENSVKAKSRKSSRSLFRHPAMIVGILLLLIIMVVISGIGWYYFYGPCGVQSVMDTDQKINGIKSRWDQALYGASKSSRVVLAQPVLDMIDVQREFRKLIVPSCMELPKSSLDKSMTYTIEAYDRFFHYESEIEVRKRLNDAGIQRKLYNQQMQTIYQCAPLYCQ